MFSFSSSEYGHTRGACLSAIAVVDKLRGLFYLHSHFTISKEKCQYIMENIVKFSGSMSIVGVTRKNRIMIITSGRKLNCRLFYCRIDMFVGKHM